ncbi:50S ribosome-binding GTPase [Ruminococcaceae bacterium YRB3002]|nr:50S ribosome-binding GTPase [Ruminococcaceae bacterium YRB3002]
MDSNAFKTGALENRIEKNIRQLLELYIDNGYVDEAEKLKESLSEIAEQNQIRIVVIGQYTAGKSTIISALTSDDSIIIDSNIATDRASDYSWGNFTLTDTPGLYTENPEHDSRTIEAIKKSDLLVYCITSDLFNQYTKADFERWAFEVGYAGKMFLVVNKMSKEAGEYIELVENYKVTLNASLLPHSINEFYHSFVDAKDYRDGIKEGDKELIELSHFEDFIFQLNSFIKSKGILGRLDTPVKLLKSSIDEMDQKVLDDDKDRAFSSMLSRIEKRIDQQRSQFQIDSRSIIKRGLKPIKEKGYELSRDIAVKDVDFSEDDFNELIQETHKEISQELSLLCDTNMQKLNEAVEDVLYSQPASFFLNAIDGTYTEKKGLFEKQETRVTRIQVDSIKALVEGITGKTLSLATKSGTQTAGFLLKASEASGSPLHQTVLKIGRTLGYKFKPWQAVNIAKNVGNAAKCAGPVVSVLAFLYSVKETIDDNKIAKENEKKQLEFRQYFIDVVDELEKAYSDELKGVYEVYDDISSQVQEIRDKVQSTISSNNNMAKEMASIRENLVEIQKEIFI